MFDRELADSIAARYAAIAARQAVLDKIEAKLLALALEAADAGDDAMSRECCNLLNLITAWRVK